MFKNVAGQRWIVFAYEDGGGTTPGAPKTGDAAQITAKIAKDGAAAAATNDTNPTELEDGYYEFDLTQAETNADELWLTPESSTANIQVVGVPGVIYTRPPNFGALGIESDGDLTKVNTLNGHTAQTADHTSAIAAVKTDTGNLVTRITSTLFSGITSLAEWLGLIAGKQTGDATARTELRASGAGSGTYDETTDSQEAIRDTEPLGTAMQDELATFFGVITGAVATDAGNSETGFEVSVDVGSDVRVGMLRLTSGTLEGEGRFVSWTGTAVTVLSETSMPTALKQFSATPADGVTFSFSPL